MPTSKEILWGSTPIGHLTRLLAPALAVAGFLQADIQAQRNDQAALDAMSNRATLTAVSNMPSQTPWIVTEVQPSLTPTSEPTETPSQTNTPTVEPTESPVPTHVPTLTPSNTPASIYQEGCMPSKSREVTFSLNSGSCSLTDATIFVVNMKTMEALDKGSYSTQFNEEVPEYRVLTGRFSIKTDVQFGLTRKRGTDLTAYRLNLNPEAAQQMVDGSNFFSKNVSVVTANGVDELVFNQEPNDIDFTQLFSYSNKNPNYLVSVVFPLNGFDGVSQAFFSQFLGIVQKVDPGSAFSPDQRNSIAFGLTKDAFTPYIKSAAGENLMALSSETPVAVDNTGSVPGASADSCRVQEQPAKTRAEQTPQAISIIEATQAGDHTEYSLNDAKAQHVVYMVVDMASIDNELASVKNEADLKALIEKYTTTLLVYGDVQGFVNIPTMYEVAPTNNPVSEKIEAFYTICNGQVVRVAPSKTPQIGITPQPPETTVIAPTPYRIISSPTYVATNVPPPTVTPNPNLHPPTSTPRPTVVPTQGSTHPAPTVTSPPPPTTGFSG